MRDNLLRVIPLQNQTGLPPDIMQQPDFVGGSLALTDKPRPDNVWDQIDADQAASAPGAAINLNQDASNFSFIATTVSQIIIPYNIKRSYLLLQNNGASDVRIGLGRDADLVSGLVLSAGGGFYEPILGVVNSIHGISVAGTSQVTVIEGFKV